MKAIGKSRNGFTMVELIVVIAIIAALAALLLPVFSHAKANAQRRVCLNNLHQINVGIQLYCGDSSDKAPKSEGIKTNEMLTLIGYKNLVQNYVGVNRTTSPRARIFACPSDTFYFTTSNSFIVVKNEPLHDQAFVNYSSYGFNGVNLDKRLVRLGLKHLGVDFSQFGVGGRPMTSIKDPSRTVLVCETPAFTPYSWHKPKKPLLDNPQYDNSMNTVSFVDGHSSYIKIFWTNTTSIGVRLDASLQNPPPSYDYKWSAN
jgi:prepilin-type N-terminal cleavage/methylation domain-containing protein